MMRRCLLTLGWLLASAAHAEGTLDYASIWQCDASKFNWYCDQDEAPPAIRKAPPAKQSPPAGRIELRDLHTAEQLRLELKRREDLAVMDPSDRNLTDYLDLWQVAQEKGAVFADRWRRVVWQTPRLDYAQNHPVNNAALKIQDATRQQAESTQLRAIAQHHGLIFFFRSDCPYCHAMAPTLKMLADQYGIEVLGVSIDGRGLPEFPQPRDGRMQAQAWGVERVPALFIGSKETGDKAPIGFGLMALTEIVNRILVLTATTPGQQF